METFKLGISLHVHKVGFELVSFSCFWDVGQPLPKESLVRVAWHLKRRFMLGVRPVELTDDVVNQKSQGTINNNQTPTRAKKAEKISRGLTPR